jgi:hypothetical protein
MIKSTPLWHSDAVRGRPPHQSWEPQRQGYPPRHPISRRKAVLPSQISPDLNPIEQVFAKLKHLLRNAASRTLESLVAAIGELLGTFTPQECADYFANAGYGRT